ncbi:MAG TPA: DUF4192 domain-containing protein, partial [Streptosporangiaceae bacterium]|nr:DUF4192 domain-containing protein [Streptosporangiaceae bacterium]
LSSRKELLMSTSPVKVRVVGPVALLAAVPYLVGYQPENSLVMVGLGGPHGRVKLAFRYDLPDPPAREHADDIAAHTAAVLGRNRLRTVAIVSYGPGTLVTPLIEALRLVLHRAGIRIHDALRIEDGRYWSYLCADPGCCPAEGGLAMGSAHPVAQALAGAGLSAAASRADLAATIGPVTGPDADAMAWATQQAKTAFTARTASIGPDAARLASLRTVQDAITVYRDDRPSATSPHWPASP